jgi:hypothetical protein
MVLPLINDGNRDLTSVVSGKSESISHLKNGLIINTLLLKIYGVIAVKFKRLYQLRLGIITASVGINSGQEPIFNIWTMFLQYSQLQQHKRSNLIHIGGCKSELMPG